MKAAIAVAAALLLLPGCALFEDRPDRSCKNNIDCFQAQGERCNVTTKTCEIPADAAALLDEDGDDSAPVDTANDSQAASEVSR